MTPKKVTHSASETVRLGKEFGSTLRRGAVVGLVGTLGAGKTQFVKGVCQAFGVMNDVLSPTFVLMHRYEGTDAGGEAVVIQHFDFYRIRRAEELDEIGFRDLVGSDAISLIEWADAFPGVLPAECRIVSFDHHGEGDERMVVVQRTEERTG